MMLSKNSSTQPSPIRVPSSLHDPDGKIGATTWRPLGYRSAAADSRIANTASVATIWVSCEAARNGRMTSMYIAAPRAAEMRMPRQSAGSCGIAPFLDMPQ